MEKTTLLIEAVRKGDDRTAMELLPATYVELRRLAAAKMASEREDHTLQPTALVHEAFLKLLGPENSERSWKNAEHFMAHAADAMRKVLIDSARRKRTGKRGGEFNRVTWNEAEFASEQAPEDSEEILAVDAALTKLEEHKPELVRLVKLRYFAGLGIAETAAVLGISESSVDRSWRSARVWLYREITRERSKEEHGHDSEDQ